MSEEKAQPASSEATPRPGIREPTAEPGMAKEKITLPDGRYLIYYTFDKEVLDTKAADDARS